MNSPWVTLLDAKQNFQINVGSRNTQLWSEIAETSDYTEYGATRKSGADLGVVQSNP